MPSNVTLQMVSSKKMPLKSIFLHPPNRCLPSTPAESACTIHLFFTYHYPTYSTNHSCMAIYVDFLRLSGWHWQRWIQL